jgi:uncharacterized protein
MLSRLLGAAVVVCTVAPACAPAPPAPKRTAVRFTSGAPGGGNYTLGMAVVRAYQAHFPDMDFEVYERAATQNNITAVARGDADFAFAYADVVYTTYVGDVRRDQPPSDEIRGIATLQLTPINLMVRAGVKAHSIRDLAGLRVGVGPAMSSTQLEVERLLDAYHVDRSQMQLVSISFDQASERLSRGTLDASFVIASYPAESVRRALVDGAVLVPIDGPVIDALRHESVFLNPTVIPAGSYPGQTSPLQTVGVHNLMVCRRDLDEDLVHELTQRFFEVLPSLLSEQESLRLVDVRQAPATPIPLHAGAARYYRERELAR